MPWAEPVPARVWVDVVQADALCPDVRPYLTAQSDGSLGWLETKHGRRSVWPGDRILRDHEGASPANEVCKRQDFGAQFRDVIETV